MQLGESLDGTQLLNCCLDANTPSGDYTFGDASDGENSSDGTIDYVMCSDGEHNDTIQHKQIGTESYLPYGWKINTNRLA